MKFSVRLLSYILSILSRLTIIRYRPFIIGITGSAGKTSAKEAIFASLSNKNNSRKTSANFNNELGLPLSILGDWNKIKRPVLLFWAWVIFKSILQLIYPFWRYPKILVLEYGADKSGDIEKLISIARPNIGIITAIGNIPVHIENYSGGIEDVFKEKSKLIASLKSSHTAIINADDPFFAKLKSRTNAKIISYGFNERADVQISNFTHVIKNDKIDGIAFKISYKNYHIPISIPYAFSVSHTYAIACAFAVSIECDIGIEDFSKYIYSYKPLFGRSVIVDGIEDTQIIDESYNSSPLALETAIKTLGLVTHKRKIAVLGDMLELGGYTLVAHEHIGEIVFGSIDVLITVGQRAKFIAYKAKEKGFPEDKLFVFESLDEAGRKLQEIMKEGDLILIKGSHSIGLEKIVESIKA